MEDSEAGQVLDLLFGSTFTFWLADSRAADRYLQIYVAQVKVCTASSIGGSCAGIHGRPHSQGQIHHLSEAGRP